MSPLSYNMMLYCMSSDLDSLLSSREKGWTFKESRLESRLLGSDSGSSSSTRDHTDITSDL